MIQLYSYPTPNGIKVPILLEELAAPYELNRVDLMKGEQRTPEFLHLNPNGKIPVLVDPDGSGGRAITITESVAILIYLATKFGVLIPADDIPKIRMFEWPLSRLRFLQEGSHFERRRSAEEITIADAGSPSRAQAKTADNTRSTSGAVILRAFICPTAIKRKFR